MSKLIYVENDYDGRYGDFWANLGEVIRDRAIFMARPADFDLVCFTGGEDVSPELYEHKNLGSGNSPRRDAVEQEVYDMAAQWHLPMTGICRGSQFLNVQCGGTMVQHLKKSHGGGLHECNTFDGKSFKVTSSHHQMSVLGENGTLLANSDISIPWADCVYDGEIPASVLQQLDERGDAPEKCIYMTEAFVYPDQSIFAVQHHPEWQNINEEAPQWTLEMIREHCFNEAGLQTQTV